MLSFSLPLCLRHTFVGCGLSSFVKTRGDVDAGGDPFVRWSRRLVNGWPLQPSLPGVCVGLEGCAGAFNALNSIRTCMYFGTALPPFFLSLTSAKDIQSLRISNEAAAVVFESVASFGEQLFLEGQPWKQFPLVALENYTDRSISILTSRFPPTARLVIGHENNGVTRKYIDGACTDGDQKNDSYCAEHVVYVPQCGTISSLNVATSMGIALFYSTLDKYYQSSRTLLGSGVEGSVNAILGNKELESLHRYQRCFRQRLPIKSLPVGSLRVDSRPIHPLYYQKNVSDIVEQHQHLRQLMLQICRQSYSSLSGRFGLSVLYENNKDQRSLGGIVRSANAFLVDNVFYFGRKKVNVVGTIGTQHYTPPVYLGPLPDNNNNSGAKMWAEELRQRIEESCGTTVNWWFLDCGHAFLYSTETTKDATALEGEESFGTTSSNESLLWYNARSEDTEFALNLCDTEDKLREAAKGGVVLIVPQEGILPPIHLLQRCNKLLSLLPKNKTSALTAGLPISVAAGIAFQRLSAVMHPEVLAF